MNMAASFSTGYFSRACEQISTARCCISSDTAHTQEGSSQLGTMLAAWAAWKGDRADDSLSTFLMIALPGTEGNEEPEGAPPERDMFYGT